MIAISSAAILSLLFIVLSTLALRLPRSQARAVCWSAVALVLFVSSAGLMYMEASGKISGWTLIPASFAFVGLFSSAAVCLFFALGESYDLRQQKKCIKSMKEAKRTSAPLSEEEINEGINWEELETWLAEHK